MNVHTISARISCTLFAVLTMSCGDGEWRRLNVENAGGASDEIGGGAGKSGSEVGGGAGGTGYGTAGGNERDDSFLFDDSKMHDFYLTMTDVDRAWMEANAPLEEYVPASLVFNEQKVGTVGVRYKGSDAAFNECWPNGIRSDSPKCAKISLKIKFNEFVPETRLFGMKRINLHGMRADVSTLKERLAYQLFREMGVETSRVTHARLTVNNTFWGVYALVEDIGGRFTADRWPDTPDGNLYKEWWWGNPREDPQRYLETNTESPDVSEILALGDAVAQSTVDTFNADVAPFVEIDDLVRYLVVDRAIANVDGILRLWVNTPTSPLGTGRNHNYFIYQKEAGGKFTLVPWDLDLTFEYPDALMDVAGTPDFNTLPADCTRNFAFWGGYAKPPACDAFLWLFAQNYWSHFVESGEAFLSGPFQIDHLLNSLDRWETQIASSVAEDPQIDPIEWRWGIDHLRGNLPLLIDRFKVHLNEGLRRE